MDVISARSLSKKFIISHEKEAMIRAILPLAFRPSYKEELWALKDATFTLKKGESLGIIGPNGAGKSVLLNVLAGITSLTSGDVELSGKVSTILTLGAGFHYELTGEENIFLNAAILGMTLKEIKQKFDNIVDFSGLDGFIDAPIQTYSSGMLLRLGFSIATHLDFDILLVDEIIGVGDLQFKEKSLNRLKNFRDKGKAIVLASQALDLIRDMTDKTIYLRKGVIEGFGDSESITKMYERSIRRSDSVLFDKDYVSRIISQRNKEQSREKVDAAWGMKTGTHQARIVNVRLMGKNKKVASEFDSGEPLEVEVAYDVREKISDPHFGVAIFREDHLYCHGPNTRIDNVSINELSSGTGIFSISYPELLLSPGTYFISVAIWEKDERYAYDYHCSFYKMIVRGKDRKSLFRQLYRVNMNLSRRQVSLRSMREIDVRFINKYKKECAIFTTNEYMKILVDLVFDRKASDLYIKVYREDGQLCFVMKERLNTYLIGLTCARIGFDISELRLLPGNYYISAEIKDKKESILTEKDRIKDFIVFSEIQDHGIVHMKHKWTIGKGDCHEKD